MYCPGQDYIYRTTLLVNLPYNKILLIWKSNLFISDSAIEPC